jgi:membrane-bound serine protease (ClpP class)
MHADRLYRRTVGRPVNPRKRRPGSILRLAAVAAILCVSAAPTARSSTVYLLDISGAIGPATAEYVEQGLSSARNAGASLVVLRIDTPGGLDGSMRSIVRQIISSPIPVASFVPGGGRAASAGTYILYASHIAAMAPGASLGAATPVQIGGPERSPFPDLGRLRGPPDQDNGKGEAQKAERPALPGMKEKIVSDAVAYIRSLAKLHGRNEDWAERAVTEAASLPAQDALKIGVIDLVAEGVEDLIRRVDGREVKILSATRTIKTSGAIIRPFAPDWRVRLLSIITDPNVAYILLLIGIYGIIFEFYSPGLGGPGIVGAISLLLGLYALQLLPINYAGAALTLLGIALIVAETFVPSFGILGIGGITAFVIGSVILIDTDAPGFGVSEVLIGAVAVTGAGTMLLTLAFLARARRRAVVSGPEQMIGSPGTVVSWSGNSGEVRVHGEMWHAEAEAPLAPGAPVRVVRLSGLTLTVEPQPEGV